MWKHQDPKQIILIGCPGFILVAIACCLTLFTFQRGQSISLFIWLLAVLGFVLLVWVGIVTLQQKARVAHYQKKRDMSASQLRDAVLAGKKIERPYFVYLRPFDIDRKFYVTPSNIPANHTYVEEYGWPTADHDLESELTDLVYAFGLLVAVSDKPGETGAAHVKAPAESWQKHVRAICSQAAGIFMVPFDYQGTAWEVNLLVSAGWLDKTFFIMPAEQRFIRQVGLKRLTSDYRNLWAAGQARYKTLALPAYHKQGEIFQLIDGKITSYFFGGLRPSSDRTAQEIGDITALHARLEELAKQTEA